MRYKVKNTSQRGDTIIEVMIAMTIMGLVLATAFATANRSLATGRAAQERAEALELSETQIELLRSANTDPTGSLATALNQHDENILFCVNSDGSGIQAFDNNVTQEELLDGQTDSRYKALCKQGFGGRYGISIKKSGDTYTVRAKWLRVDGSTALEEIKLSYRIYAVIWYPDSSVLAGGESIIA